MADESLLVDVAERIVSIRTGLGWEIELAAEMAHLEPERLAEAEAGESALTETELQGLADAFGVDITAFFGGRTTPMSYLFGG
ncbi:MAG: helix-turn-helix domain-containing protein [Vulcanimicrobiaceae bacterium]